MSYCNETTMGQAPIYTQVTPTVFSGWIGPNPRPPIQLPGAASLWSPPATPTTVVTQGPVLGPPSPPSPVPVYSLPEVTVSASRLFPPWAFALLALVGLSFLGRKRR